MRFCRRERESLYIFAHFAKGPFPETFHPPVIPVDGPGPGPVCSSSFSILNVYVVIKHASVHTYIFD